MNTPKVLGYIPLHYGAEYLRESIRSMDPHVEKIIVVYCPKGSQGHATSTPCPESEELLMRIAHESSQKIEWHKVQFFGEGAHRSYIMQFSEGYDIIFTLDADEIVNQDDIGPAIQQAFESDKRNISIKGFINFWRNFEHVCLDGFLPFRMINLRNREGNATIECRIYHFGTCQSINTIRYKWLVSGHKNEIKHDWIDGCYLKWTPENNFGDLHPVSRDLWNTIPFDKNTLPEDLKQHPNFNKHLVQ